MDRTASFSACGRYRHALGRRWAPGPRAVFVMLNPSTAGAGADDPTIRRCIGFARAWGHAGVEVVNLFAWRATRPSDLKAASDPVGPAGDAPILRAARRGAITVAAWGVHGSHLGRGAKVAARLRAAGIALHALGTTKAGAPRHPLYLRRDAAPAPWEAP